MKHAGGWARRSSVWRLAGAISVIAAAVVACGGGAAVDGPDAAQAALQASASPGV